MSEMNAVIGALLWVAGVYLMWRNVWVYRNRVALIWSDMAAYKAAPSYDAMLLRYFWDWNFERLAARSRT